MEDEFTTLMHAEWAATPEEAEEIRAIAALSEYSKGMPLEQALSYAGITKEIALTHLDFYNQVYRRNIVLE